MLQKRDFDLVIIGGGPGGYVSAIRGGQLGLKIALIEKGDLGGTCLNIGCIPTKTLIRSAEVLSLFRRAEYYGISVEGLNFDYSMAVDRSRKVVERLRKGVGFLLKKNCVEVIKGAGRLDSDNKVKILDGDGEAIAEVEGRNIIIATGSRAKIPRGFELDKDKIITSTEALFLTKLPGSMVIIGGGAVGVEFAYLFSTYGVDVTLIEAMSHLLPEGDEEIAEILKNSLKKMGIKVLEGWLLKGVEKKDVLKVEITSEDGSKFLEANSLLLAIGREPNSESIGLEDLGVETDRGFIKTEDFMETTVSGVYAIGDVASPPLLAHKAMMEGVLAVERIAGKDGSPIDRSAIPRCVYTQPQVASIGLTEREAVEAGHKVKVGRFPFRANGKALTMGEEEGMVKIISDIRYGEILGAHLIGPEVTELIGELVLARVMEATSLELSNSIHPHPTLSEAIMEAGGAVFGSAIHI